MDPGPLAGPEQIAHAAALLRQGGLVAFPTETVYGLGADALNPAAVQAVFLMKGRPATNPLIVHVTGVDMAARLIQPGALTERAARLMRAFWPGPLSIVLPKAPSIPELVTGGGQNVALRSPDHPVALALLFAFDGPLVGPSANLSGAVSPTTADHVRHSFTQDQVYTLDGGPSHTGIESTVLSLITPRPTILRPGIIGPEAISKILGEPVFTSDIRHPTSDIAFPSPGLLPSHYAPTAPATLFDDWVDLEDLTPRPLVVLSHSLMAERDDAAFTLIELPPDPRAYAAALYAALRRADALNPALIAIHTPPREGHDPESTAVWRAVHDRLTRATARK